MPNSPPPSSNPISLDGSPLGVLDVEHVARNRRPVALAEDARMRIERTALALGHIAQSGEPIYGVNTGFGSLARQRIDHDQLADMQRNLIRSHAAGVGKPFCPEIIRATMLLLAASLARASSGVRPVVVDRLIEFLNTGVTPVVPSIGSVGASGDLAPLAHIAQVLLGEGLVTTADSDSPVPAGPVLAAAGIEPIELAPKEGLALINGTHLMAARAALTLADTERLLDAALCAAAMSIDGVRATDAFLDERAYTLRNQPGPARVATRLRQLLDGSKIVTSHVEGDTRVQDPYSFRCAAYVLGAATDAIEHVRHRLDDELGAVTDNPLIIAEDADEANPSVISAGNFHGMPIALPLDLLAIALAHVAGIAERRVFYMLAARESESQLRPHLSPRPGVQSGFMVTQYTAAACCNELVGLANPATVANLSTCAGMEDYNSFGPRAAEKAARAVELTRSVIAIELLCAAQAIEAQRPLTSGSGVERAHTTIREVVAPLEADRSTAPDIAAIEHLIATGRFR